MKFTLMPWMERITGAIDARLVGPIERIRYYTEFLPDALLQVNVKTR